MGERQDVWLAYVELAHRYADATDRAAGAEVAALFTDDGRWDGTEFGLAVLADRSAIEGHFSTEVDEAPSVHLVHNALVEEVSGSSARATSLAQALLPREGGVRQLIVGYEDELRRVDGRWLFAERVLRRRLRL